MLGMLYEQKGTPDRAITTYSKALDHDRNNALLVRALANAHHRSGNLPAAEITYRRALELDGQDSRAWFLLGNLQRQMGRPTDAAASLKKAVELDTEGDVDLLLLLGITCLEAGKYDDAENTLREVQRLDRDNQAASNALSEIAYLRTQVR
jgi:tetratricopeptide (TPR) repeat protein